jgi:hypothetical protein
MHCGEVGLEHNGYCRWQQFPLSYLAFRTNPPSQMCGASGLTNQDRKLQEILTFSFVKDERQQDQFLTASCQVAHWRLLSAVMR